MRGCDEKAGIEITMLIKSGHSSSYCHIHFTQYLTYMASFLSTKDEFKDHLKEGLKLFSENER